LENNQIIPDYLVIGIGTGGTITGIARVMKKKYPQIKVIGILPEDRIEGLRGFQEFKPPILDLSLVDELINVKEAKAKESMKQLVLKYGLLVGISSGAAFYLSKDLAIKFKGKNIVTLFPDGIEKYLSYM
jgi:cysteine synthase A